VNVAFLLISTAVSAGADPGPVAAAPPTRSAAALSLSPAPVVAGSCGSGGCGGCGAVSDCCGGADACCESGGLFARLRARFGGHHGHHDCGCGCEVAPSCCGSAPTPVISSAHSCCGNGHGATSCCGSCGTVSSCCDGCGEKPSLLDRLRARFHRGHGEDCCGCGCDNGCGGHYTSAGVGAHIPTMPGAPPGTGMPAEPIKKMPKPVDKPNGMGDKPNGMGDKPNGTGLLTPAPAPSLTPAAAKAKEETKNPFELDRRYEERVGRAADNSRLTGQLFFVHADGGLWVLRYAPLGKEDANGGSVVLARDRQMDSYREGDLVTVHGEIVKERGSSRLGGPLYRVRTIQLVDRPQQ
jgi:hypothetical protein